MAVQTFRLPDPGEGLVEADIVTWRVAIGDKININDILLEVETSKSVVELPSPFAGTVMGPVRLKPRGARASLSRLTGQRRKRTTQSLPRSPPEHRFRGGPTNANR